MPEGAPASFGVHTVPRVHTRSQAPHGARGPSGAFRMLTSAPMSRRRGVLGGTMPPFRRMPALSASTPKRHGDHPGIAAPFLGVVELLATPSCHNT